MTREFKIPKLYKAKVVKIEKLTWKTTLVTFGYMEPQDFYFRSGQFINLKVSDVRYRSYSICSDPLDTKNISIAASVAHDGVGSNYIRSLKHGDPIEFIGPSGRFTLDGYDHRPLFFVGTGTGICPFIPMLYKLRDENYEQPITLIYGVRKETDILFEEEINAFKKDLKLDLQIVVSQPSDWYGKQGRVTQYIPIDKNGFYYVCGHPDMVNEVEERLISQSVPEVNIHTEEYTSPGKRR